MSNVRQLLKVANPIVQTAKIICELSDGNYRTQFHVERAQFEKWALESTYMATGDPSSELYNPDGVYNLSDFLHLYITRTDSTAWGAKAWVDLSAVRSVIELQIDRPLNTLEWQCIFTKLDLHTQSCIMSATTARLAEIQ